jgi:cysteinyl-tRNA synthetase
MRLYNPASGAIERFRPSRGRPVGVYVCGITPYDTTHLGHAFTYMVFDVLIRHFETTYGWPVRYVQNVTDIDDDILKRAGELGTDWRSLGGEWTDRFTGDLAALNLRPPDHFVGATAYIAEILSNIQRLVDQGLAYASGGSVYFAVDRDPAFGGMSGLGREEMLETANQRGNDPDDPRKADPLDFVLWQATGPGEPAWNSPWGPGRPGWHIECSSMALALLGPQVDIHGGGADLAFPHHCCEVAQSEPLTDARPWVRFWVHIAMVHMDGEKMSKSLGNLVMIRRLLEAWEPDTIRLYLLRHHYRTAWEWNEATFESTAAWTRTLHAAMARASGRGFEIDPSIFGPHFTAALEDDLDTPTAVDVCLRLADTILDAPMGANVAAAQDVLRAIAGRVLGLWLRPLEDVPPEARGHWPAPVLGEPDVAAFAAADGADDGAGEVAAGD